MSPMDSVSPATNAVLARCASRSFITSMHLTLPASIAAGSRFSGGVRMSPQNTRVSGGCATVSCQSIQLLAHARECASAGSSLAAPDFGARERTVEVRFPNREAASSSGGPRPLGVMAEICGLLVLAEGAADVDALVRQLELAHRPHHLLHVDRGVAPPDFDHGSPFRSS